MTDAWGSLHIEVVDGEIVVTAPFTSYTVTYYKPEKSGRVEGRQRQGARAGVDRLREAGVEAARPELGRVLINRQPNSDLDVLSNVRYWA